MDFSAKISNVIKICESDQNVEFRLKMIKIIKIWKSGLSKSYWKGISLIISRQLLSAAFDNCGYKSRRCSTNFFRSQSLQF